MDRIVDYTVVSEHDLKKMVGNVQVLIEKHGWQPFGSFQIAAPVSREAIAPVYCQAMVKYA